jgi:hypothetical protein
MGLLLSGDSIQRHLLAGADGFDDFFGRASFAQPVGDVFTLDQASNIGEQAWLDARHAARREQEKDQLSAFVGGIECDAFVGASKGEQRALEIGEPPMRDGRDLFQGRCSWWLRVVARRQ